MSDSVHDWLECSIVSESGIEMPFPTFCRHQEKRMQKKLLATALLAVTLALSGCAADGNRYRSDVYRANQVNQAQEVRTVELIAVNPAQVEVSNSGQADRAKMTGALIGAIAGSLIASQHTDRDSSRIASGVGGAALGGMIGDSLSGSSDSKFVDGVQLVYRTAEGKIYQSAQVGRLCEFRTGTALLVSSERGETRIQPNNPYGCAQMK